MEPLLESQSCVQTELKRLKFSNFVRPFPLTRSIVRRRRRVMDTPGSKILLERKRNSRVFVPRLKGGLTLSLGKLTAMVFPVQGDPR